MDLDVLQLDVLPASCGLVVELDEAGECVRFAARRLEGDEVIGQSRWSGWFKVEDTPIVLSWSAFDWVYSDSGARRERPVPCRVCRKPALTFNWSAVCDRCLGL